MRKEFNLNYDLLVIGGGVNGTGIAADAAGRGLNVLLCEQMDLASATSSNSSKLIHGGLRYLEHYKFRLVKEALSEREVLLTNAPHIMRPLRFILPYQPHLRPAWMIRAGLFLYDNLTKRVSLERSHGVTFTETSPLVSEITKGVEYSDGWVDDARLVVLNAVQAQRQGAEILTNCTCSNAQRINGLWRVKLTKRVGEKTKEVNITANAIVNAAGPWVTDIFTQSLNIKPPQNLRLIKGSHIIVPKIHFQDKAYILQNADGRVVFVLPFEQDFSIVGTTDVEYQGEPRKVAVDDSEIDYLIDISNQYFKTKITRDDIVRTYSGVRPLLEDESGHAQKVTRDYILELQAEDEMAPLLSVFGGKITTYRKLSEVAVNKLMPFFEHMKPAWTAQVELPGGDFTDQKQLVSELSNSYPFMRQKILERYVRSYGTLALTILHSIENEEQLGEHFGHGLYQVEVDYLMEHEWAVTAEDILWRRSKLGLRFDEKELARLQQYVSDKPVEQFYFSLYYLDK